MIISVKPKQTSVRNDALGVPLLSSVAIHTLVILLCSIGDQNSFRRQDFLPITLVDVPPTEALEKSDPAAEIKKLPSRPANLEKAEKRKPIAKTQNLKPEQPAVTASSPIKDEPADILEINPNRTGKPEIAASPMPNAQIESGGSGVGGLLTSGEVAVAPGLGSSGAGGRTAASGLGKGSGAPGLPGSTTPFRTDREAKPLQTARASYPPMALRMGIEGDVTLRIEIDTEGRVTKAEILKSGGMGFDDEALKAVKQSRFEPAQADGKPVPAQFTYVYRFRLQR